MFLDSPSGGVLGLLTGGKLGPAVRCGQGSAWCCVTTPTAGHVLQQLWVSPTAECTLTMPPTSLSLPPLLRLMHLTQTMLQPVCLLTASAACHAAVGLSYSGVHADYTTNDTATAADSNAFLRGFFERHPHLAANNFYISGAQCSCWFCDRACGQQ